LLPLTFVDVHSLISIMPTQRSCQALSLPFVSLNYPHHMPSHTWHRARRSSRFRHMQPLARTAIKSAKSAAPAAHAFFVCSISLGDISCGSHLLPPARAAITLLLLHPSVCLLRRCDKVVLCVCVASFYIPHLDWIPRYERAAS
jgi:hypothetical protein